MVTINDKKYDLIKDERGGFDLDEVTLKLTDYFDDYDYIVGDWSYGKLRLKGFNDKKSKNYKDINDIEKLDEYIEKYCAYGCKYFVLKKINVD